MYGQQYANFENQDDFNFQLDTANPNNIWQIGEPQKTVFNSARSIPNALVTDTINPYADTNLSECQFTVDASVWSFYPYQILMWDQRIDAEENKDGGWIEVSYDTGQTWANMFTDTTWMLRVNSDSKIDTLANGEVGFTGHDSVWSSFFICWSTGNGLPPTPLDGRILIRLLFYSDSISTNQDGWLIDNLESFPSFIDFIPENTKQPTFELSVFPNPVQNDLTIEFEMEKTGSLRIEILDLQGRLLKEVVNRNEGKGWKSISTSLNDLNSDSKVFVVRCIIDENYRNQELIIRK